MEGLASLVVLKHYLRYTNPKHTFLRKVTFNCLNLSKMNLKFELKSNFEVRKLDILKLIKYRVTLDISKVECRETGGLLRKPAFSG